MHIIGSEVSRLELPSVELTWLVVFDHLGGSSHVTVSCNTVIETNL